MRRTQPNTVSIATDDRARIPFAVIGVLLLVSSVMIVATLETRSEPEIDRATDVAIDRGEAYATGQIRHATVRATDQVVRSPLTTVDSDMEDVLDEDDAFEEQTRLTIFAEVTAALDGREQDVGQGRTVETSVPEVDDWTDEDELARAIDYVELEEEDGIMDVTIANVEFTVVDDDGTVETVTTRDITVSVGTTMMKLHERVEEYEDYLNKGMLDSVAYRDGYGYDLAKRLWPLVWGKAYYDRLLGDASDRAFENVTPNDHTEVMANDARFTAQQEVFGTQDDYGNRVMAGPFMCMAFDLADAGLESIDRDRFDEIADNLHPDENVSSIDDLCKEGVVSPDGELPDMPTIEEIIAGMLDNVDKSGEIQGHPFADLAYHEMEGGYDQDDIKDEVYEPLNETDRFTEQYLNDYFEDSDRFDPTDEGNDVNEFINGFEQIQTDAINTDGTDDVIDDVYTVNSAFDGGGVSRDGGTHPFPPRLDSDDYDTENYTIADTSRTTSRIGVDASIEKATADGGDTGLDRSLVSVETEIEMRYTTRRAWNDTNTNSSIDVIKSESRTTNYTGYYELHGEFAPESELRPNDIDHVLDSGGSAGPVGTATNWGDAADEVTEAFFGEKMDSDSDLEGWLRSRDRDIESDSDFRDAIKYETDYEEELVIEPNNRDLLHSWIMGLLLEVHLETVTEVDPVKAELMDILDADPSPFRKHEDGFEEMENEHVDDTTAYENAPDLARMEARQTYFDNIYEHIDDVANEHEKVAQGGENMLNDLLGEFLDDLNAIINGPMDLLDEMLGAGEEMLQDEGGAEVDTPEVLNDVNIDVDGSPTYHSSQVAVNQTDVPAVRARGDGPLDIDEDVDFAPMGAGYENEVGLPGFPLLPWPPLFYLQADVWHIEIEGEYARFEVEATSSDPSVSDSTTYVREDKDVMLETPQGDAVQLGSTDPIEYENGQTILVMVPAPQFLPQGAPGVGDNTMAGAPGELCTPLWDEIGPEFGEDDPEPKENCL